MSDDKQDNEGMFKKPMKDSFKRVGNKMEQEMQEKTPSEALRDDFGGQREPTQEEQANLDNAVEEKRSQRAD